MFAIIHACDTDDLPDGGKRHIVNTSDFFAGAALRWGQRVFVIEATVRETHGTGWHGGACKEVERKFSLHLTGEELRTVVERAIADGMLVAPGTDELFAAHESLSMCMQKLGIRVPGDAESEVDASPGPNVSLE